MSIKYGKTAQIRPEHSHHHDNDHYLENSYVSPTRSPLVSVSAPEESFRFTPRSIDKILTEAEESAHRRPTIIMPKVAEPVLSEDVNHTRERPRSCTMIETSQPLTTGSGIVSPQDDSGRKKTTGLQASNPHKKQFDELLPVGNANITPVFSKVESFKYEGLSDCPPPHIVSPASFITLTPTQNNEVLSAMSSQSWYRDYFVGKDHQNFICSDSPLGGPCIISTKKERTNKQMDFNDVLEQEYYRVIVRSRDGEQRLVIPASVVDQRDEYGFLMMQVNPLFANVKLYLCPDPELVDNLIDYESKSFPKNFKFGILYCKGGQKLEGQMFGNTLQKDGTGVSKEYKDFLQILGDQVDLLGFKKWSGGLDTKRSQTGEKSIFTEWEGNEVMFHVSTLLPHKPSDEQHIEKKRHIGNDIVLLVFEDEDVETPFSPATVASRFIEVIIVVRVERRKKQDESGSGSKEEVFYRLGVASKKLIPGFPPNIPDHGVLRKEDPNTGKWLLAKMILGELAAYRGPSFFEKLRMSRNMLITDSVKKFQDKIVEVIDKKKNRRSRTIVNGLHSMLRGTNAGHATLRSNTVTEKEK